MTLAIFNAFATYSTFSFQGDCLSFADTLICDIFADKVIWRGCKAPALSRQFV